MQQSKIFWAISIVSILITIVLVSLVILILSDKNPLDLFKKNTRPAIVNDSLKPTTLCPVSMSKCPTPEVVVNNGTESPNKTLNYNLPIGTELLSLGEGDIALAKQQVVIEKTNHSLNYLTITDTKNSRIIYYWYIGSVAGERDYVEKNSSRGVAYKIKTLQKEKVIGTINSDLQALDNKFNLKVLITDLDGKSIDFKVLNEGIKF